MSRSSGRFAAAVAVLAILLSACASQDVDGSDAASVLDDAGASEAVSKCVGDGFDDEFSQKELNEIGKADTLSKLDNDLEARVQGILDGCVQSEGETSSGEGSSDATDTTDTTEAGEAGDSTVDSTTTSAPAG